MKQVAVLGAGFQGVCIALELARQGWDVLLFDKENSQITQAGIVNEGKIHLGFVYANEPCHSTADVLIEGALRFDEPVRRWAGLESLEPLLSTPYLYGVQADTMVEADMIERHFDHIGARIAGRSYLGVPLSVPWRRLDRIELENWFDNRLTTAAFVTEERAVDPEKLANRLRAAVAAEPRIEWRGGCAVESVAADGPRFVVSYHDGQGRRRETVPHVVNCLWTDRARVDSTLGLPPQWGFYHRYKAGVRFSLSGDEAATPSATFLLGPYGDAVNFGGGDYYLSWYPAGMLATSRELAPPDWRGLGASAVRQGVIEQTVAAAARLLPAVQGREADVVAAARVAGGTIVAAGDSDIMDHDSRLHRRIDIGVRSFGGYHSVDPGKYSMAPYFALQTVERLTGETPS